MGWERGRVVVMWGGGEGGGGGGGGADGVYSERVCSCGLTHMQLIKKQAGASALVPSAGLTSRNPSTPVPCEGRFQASQCKPHPTPSGEKDCEVRPPHPPLLRRRRGGAQSFPSPRRWMPWIPNIMRRCTWRSLPG